MPSKDKKYISNKNLPVALDRLPAAVLQKDSSMQPCLQACVGHKQYRLTTENFQALPFYTADEETQRQYAN